MLWRETKRLLSSIAHMEFMKYKYSIHYTGIYTSYTHEYTHATIKQINATKIQAIYLVLQLCTVAAANDVKSHGFIRIQNVSTHVIYLLNAQVHADLSCCFFNSFFCNSVQYRQNDVLRERKMCVYAGQNSISGWNFSLVISFSLSLSLFKSNYTWKSYNRVVSGLSTKHHAMSACMVNKN